jgi:phage terminase large subunit-like protein
MMELSDLLDGIDVERLDERQVRELLKEVEAAVHAEKYGKFYTYFPDDGPLRRELYPKHLEFFRAGATHTERLLLAANRVGKTECGTYESTCHLGGLYPGWWEGHVWNRPIRMWAAGDFNETTRDVIQKKMLGGVEWYGDKKGVDGSGMIPRDSIVQDTITWKAGVPDLIDTVRIDHKSLSGPVDGTSTLGLKSYQQGRRSFQGTEQDLIWTDEEPPPDVYNEMLIRLMTTKGIAMLTFTPLMGWTQVVDSFYPERAKERAA